VQENQQQLGIVDKTVTSRPTKEFHCLTITLFYARPADLKA